MHSLSGVTLVSQTRTSRATHPLQGHSGRYLGLVPSQKVFPQVHIHSPECSVTHLHRVSSSLSLPGCP